MSLCKCDLRSSGEKGRRPWGRETDPRPRPLGGLLTDVGMFQKTADPSLSLQLLVICGQRATRCDLVPQQPVPTPAPKLLRPVPARHTAQGGAHRLPQHTPADRPCPLAGRAGAGRGCQMFAVRGRGDRGGEPQVAQKRKCCMFHSRADTTK